MYIVPIVQREINKSSKKNLVKCVLLLDKNGTRCISIEDSVSAESFCEANDLHMIGSPVKHGDIIFVNVDTEMTDMESFYIWSEILPNTIPMKEAWRHFVWNDDTDDKWGINLPLYSIECTNTHSIGQLFDAYFKR